MNKFSPVPVEPMSLEGMQRMRAAVEGMKKVPAEIARLRSTPPICGACGKIVASWKVTEEAEHLKLEAECCGYELVRVSYREIERGFVLGKAIRRP